MNRWVWPAAALVLAMVISSCGGDDQRGPSAAKTAADDISESTAPPTASQFPSFAITPTPGTLSEINEDSILLVKGRDHLQACVQLLDDDADLEDARTAVEQALREASKENRWPGGFGVPTVDSGCPLGPIALERAGRSSFRGELCREAVSPYLVFVFVGNSRLLVERFPSDLVRRSGGVRKAGQEALMDARGECALSVSEAWYLTPDELTDRDLLRRYIFGEFGIFPIAEICC